MNCEFCNNFFIPNRSDKMFCSNLCQNKNWVKNNHERIKELWRNNYRKHSKKKILATSRYRKLHPEIDKAYCKKYSQTENGKIRNRIKVKAYRARKLGAEGRHTREDFLKLVLEFNNICPACNKELDTSKFTEDHIVPLSCGGSDYISNIQPLCAPCNAGKRNKTINYRILQGGINATQ